MSGDFVCGTRRVVKRGPGDFRVVCATCGGGGAVQHGNLNAAQTAAVRTSSRPCPAKPPCGAK